MGKTGQRLGQRLQVARRLRRAPGLGNRLRVVLPFRRGSGNRRGSRRGGRLSRARGLGRYGRREAVAGRDLQRLGHAQFDLPFQQRPGQVPIHLCVHRPTLADPPGRANESPLRPGEISTAGARARWRRPERWIIAMFPLG